MPLYEYRCQRCGYVAEVLQKLSDPPLRRCPACKGKMEKLVSRTSFQLKGGGWYNEGYGKTSSKPADEASASTDAKSKKTEAETKAKPEAKSTSKSSGSA
jgi:putative FmdB family regulatory protein